MLSGDGDDHNPLSAGEFWRYDPSNDLWTQLTSHPGDAIWAPGSFVIGCDAYFLLGENNNYNNPILPIAMYKYKLDNQCGCIDPLALNYLVLQLMMMVVVVIFQDVQILRLLIITLMRVMMMVVVPKQFLAV